MAPLSAAAVPARLCSLAAARWLSWSSSAPSGSAAKASSVDAKGVIAARRLGRDSAQTSGLQALAVPSRPACLGRLLAILLCVGTVRRGRQTQLPETHTPSRCNCTGRTSRLFRAWRLLDQRKCRDRSAEFAALPHHAMAFAGNFPPPPVVESRSSSRPTRKAYEAPRCVSVTLSAARQ